MKLYKYIGKGRYASIEQIFESPKLALEKAKIMVDHGFVEYEIITLEQ